MVFCGGARFQRVPTRNVPSELRPDKTPAPRVPSKMGSFFFLLLLFFYLSLVESVIQASGADTWVPLRLHPVTLFFKILVFNQGNWTQSQASSAVVLNIYVHPWLPCLLLTACCRGDSAGVASRVLCSMVTSLLLHFRRLLLGFQGVYERLDATLHAAGHPAGHGVGRRRRGGAGTLGWRPRHQTLLIAQLRKEKSRLAFLGFWL